MTGLRHALIGLLCLAALPAAAQEYPRKPVHMIVPYAPGGNVDVTARIVAEQLTQTLHQPFVVDNKPGAGGMIAGEFVARAAPDGYTLFVGSNGPLILSPLVYAKPLYKTEEAFTAVSSFSFTPTLLVINPSLKIDGIKGFFDLAHQKSLAVSVDAAGSINHVGSELLQSIGGVKWRNVHYRGNAEGITDLLGGHIDGAIGQVTVVSEYIKEGKLKAIAVLGRERLKDMPSVPTLQEAGFKPVDASAWNGLVAPAKTPQPILRLLSEHIVTALKRPDVLERFEKLGIVVRGSTPEAFQKFLNDETATWGPVVRDAHITAD
jgi:tripartite-type tricarboxylate transporter receptor subunit TctC